MATGKLPLPMAAATVPDGSASNAVPALIRRKSSASAPAPYWLEWAFDAAGTEQIMWGKLRMPDDYASAPVLNLIYKMASAVTGTVRLEGRLAAYTPDSDTTDADAKAFAAANNVTDTVPATTAGKEAAVSITLTNADSLAAGDSVIVYFARIGGDATEDTAAGDLELVAAELSYTTT